MSRMIRWPERALSGLLALGALAAAAPVHAQQVMPRMHQERQDCRCVDRDGKPIEKCTCFVMPDVERLATAFEGFSGRARLGITLDAQAGARGARVASVMEDGPADDAGLREGDVITSVDGKSLLQPLDPEQERDFDEDAPLPVQRLTALVREIDPGQDVVVEYLRDGEARTATVQARDLGGWSLALRRDAGAPVILRERLRPLPEHMDALRGEMQELRLRAPRGEEIRIWADSLRSHREMAPEGGARAFYFRSGDADGILRECPGGHEGPGVWVLGGGCLGGVELVALNPGLAEYFGTDAGVLVADVHQDSKLGLRPGDVILEVGDREARNPERVRRVLASYGADEQVTLRILRQKREMSVQGTLAR